MKKMYIFIIVLVLFCGCQSRPKAPSFSAIVKMLKRSQKFDPDIENKLWGRLGLYLDKYGYDKIYFDSLSKSESDYDFYPSVRMLYGYNLKYDKMKDECVPTDSNYFGFYYVGHAEAGLTDTLYMFMSDSVTFNSYRMQAKEVGFDNRWPEYGTNHYIYLFPERAIPENLYTGYVMDCIYTKKIKYGFAIVGN